MDLRQSALPALDELDGKSYCYKLTLTGKSVRWVRNDGRSGTARIGG